MKPGIVFKAATVVLGLLLATGEAQAITRYTSTAMSCAAIHSRINAEGAVILRWTQAPNIQRYNRFVASTDQCYGTQVAVPTTVPAADTPNCHVNICKQCRPYDLFDLLNGRC